jgi:ABC-type transporter Mla MlaB component
VVDDTHESRDNCRSTGGGVVALDISWLVPADLAAVDALARLQVVASRRGHRLQLHGADGGLVELVELVGLGEVVHLCPRCGANRPGAQP